MIINGRGADTDVEFEATNLQLQKIGWSEATECGAGLAEAREHQRFWEV
jgi:hypothetical protein